MQTHTAQILEATLKADATIAPAERNKILKIARGESIPAPVQTANGNPPKIYSRAEAAKILGDKTPRYIDQLCQRGLLKKFMPPGNVRGIGVTSASLHQFLGIGA